MSAKFRTQSRGEGQVSALRCQQTSWERWDLSLQKRAKRLKHGGKQRYSHFWLRTSWERLILSCSLFASFYTKSWWHGHNFPLFLGIFACEPSGSDRFWRLCNVIKNNLNAVGISSPTKNTLFCVRTCQFSFKKKSQKLNPWEKTSDRLTSRPALSITSI